LTCVTLMYPDGRLKHWSPDQPSWRVDEKIHAAADAIIEDLDMCEEGQ